MIPYEESLADEWISREVNEYILKEKKVLLSNNKVYEPKLYPWKIGFLKKLSLYFISIILLCYSLIIVYCELLIFKPEITVIYQMIVMTSNFTLNYFVTIFFILTLTFYTLFTITNIKFYDFYTLVPHHTDCLSLSSLSGLLSKTVSVLLINYVILLD